MICKFNCIHNSTRCGLTRPVLDREHCGQAQNARLLLLRSSAVVGSILPFFCPISLFLSRFHRKDLQYQNTLKQTNTLDNNTAKGLTNINKGVQFSTKQHSSATSRPFRKCFCGFVSVAMLPKEETLVVLLQGSNARFPYFLIRRYATWLLFCVASYSC